MILILIVVQVICAIIWFYISKYIKPKRLIDVHILLVWLMVFAGILGLSSFIVTILLTIKRILS